MAALTLIACGGGGESGVGAAPVPASSVATSAQQPAAVAGACVATVPAIDMATEGVRFRLGDPVVVELLGLSAPAAVRLQNLTTEGSFTVSHHVLGPNTGCQEVGTPSTLTEGRSGTQVLTDLGASGTRWFVKLQPVTPAIVEVCTRWGTGAGPCQPDLQTLHGRVLDVDDQPMADAKVTLANAGILDSTLTDANGLFVLSTPKATLPDAFSATISKPGHVPIALPFVKPASGQPIGIQSQRMRVLGADHAVVEIEPVVHHLGDSNYGGAVNSQFQFPNAEGSRFDREFMVDPGAIDKATANILFIAKGVQCRNQVLVNGLPVFRMDNSAPDGSYSSYEVPVPAGLFRPGSNLFSIVANKCSSNDLDDFEFQNIVIRFE